MTYYRNHRIQIEDNFYEISQGSRLVATGFIYPRTPFTDLDLLDKAKRLIDADFETETLQRIRAIAPARYQKSDDYVPLPIS